MAKWINKIIYKRDKEENEVTATYDIGTTFDQVRKTANSSFTLAAFFDKVQTFFKKPMFMLYSADNHGPADTTKIMEWYSIHGTDIDNRLKDNIHFDA